MTEIRATEYFAIIPETVLYADISANAVRLYATLNRFANSNGRCWPSRKTIADLMRCSTATVDRAKEELIALGVLTVTHRTSDSGDPTSNLYTLSTNGLVDKLKALSPVTQGIGTGEDTGIRTDDALNKVSINESQKRSNHQCEECSGDGWIPAGEKDGYSYVRRCGCIGL